MFDRFQQRRRITHHAGNFENVHKDRSIKHNKIEHDKKTYYYIYGLRNDGQHFLWGAYATEAEAERIAVARCNSPYEIISLHTRDMSAANALMRDKEVKGTIGEHDRDINDVFGRFSHKGGQ